MRQIQIPFEEKLFTFEQGDSWEKFSKSSPTGLLPCLIDEDTLVWDSLAIVEYLAEAFSSVWPKNKNARAWARSATSEMHSGFQFFNSKSLSCSTQVKLKTLSEKSRKDINRINELWQEGLNKFGGPFLAGRHFTAVDAFYSPVVIKINNYGLSIDEKPRQYVNRILALPNLKQWIEQALCEPWRVQEYEEIERQAGISTKDLRT